MVQNTIVSRKRTVHTYAELWHASGLLLKVGEKEIKGSSYQFLSSIVLTAFSFEAFLNHVGIAVLKSWKAIDRLSTSAKLDLLCEMLEVNLPPIGERPRQTLGELFIFRNVMAHGRTETIQPEPEIVASDAWDPQFTNPLRSHWQRQIENAEFAKRSREDVAAIMTLLHNACPEPKEDLFAFGKSTSEDVGTVED